MQEQVSADQETACESILTFRYSTDKNKDWIHLVQNQF